MHPFLKKVLFANKLKYEEDGSLTLMNTPAYLFSLNALVILQKTLEDTLKDKGREIMESFLEVQTAMAARMMTKRFGYKKAEAMKMQLGHVEMIGAGKIRMTKCDFEKKEFRFVAESTFAREYKKMFGIQKKGIDYLLIGGLRAFIREHTGIKNVVCEEVQCIAMGSQTCEFVVREGKEGTKNKGFKNEIWENAKKAIPSGGVPMKRQ
ncbi:hypothetical protein D6764_01590 [Candidatus Woesearchaeota archaeon]|nr:MAG: hypothetical protein D6764_01590 [Candidatus Woesearchaeota archaeon]